MINNYGQQLWSTIHEQQHGQQHEQQFILLKYLLMSVMNIISLKCNVLR